MEKIASTEQWKLEGDCLRCRRSTYCKTVCSAQKRHANQLIEKAYNDVLQEKYPELANIMKMTSQW